jgi:hypothetical protein
VVDQEVAAQAENKRFSVMRRESGIVGSEPDAMRQLAAGQVAKPSDGIGIA